jgi:hypothetical protein
VDYDNDGSGEIAAAFAAIASVAQLKHGAQAVPEFRASDLVNWGVGNVMLRDAMEQSGCADAVNTAKVGYWLRALKNRMAGGLKLVCRQVDGGRQPNKWMLVDPSAMTGV